MTTLKPSNSRVERGDSAKVEAVPSSSNRKLLAKLLLLVVGMFAFGYALVPLYDVICDITGLNGKNARLLEASSGSIAVVDENREITVYFTGSVASGLGWQFRPVVSKMTVNPGREYSTDFFAENQLAAEVTGNAVPSVAPNQAAKYFLKTECFCFTEQTLVAGERRQMPVRFVVDPSLPKDIDSVALAYTFYKTDQVASN